MLRELGILSRAIHHISDVKYKEFNLQKGQFVFLTRICENPRINFIELSNMLKVDKTTTTKAVSKLIDLGYVYKECDKLDKRAYNLMPTARALEIYDHIIEEENRSIDVCFDGFSEEDKDLALELMRKMRKNIELDWINTKNKGDR